MIRNGYFFPVKENERLVHYDYELDTVVGDCAVCICYGDRTGGKTVGWSLHWIERYLKYGERCCLAARTIKQMEKGYLKKFWEKTINIDNSDDEYTQSLLNELRTHEIEINKYHFLIDGDIFCYCVALSDAYAVKDEMVFNKCRRLIIDEAMRKNESTLTINGIDAMELIWLIVVTMARGDDLAINTTAIVFMSNSTERDNWIFNDLQVNKYLRNDSKFVSRNGVLVSKVNNKIATSKLKNSALGTVMGNSISGKAELLSATESLFSDNTDFIERKGLDFNNLIIQFVIRHHYIGVFQTSEGYHIAKIDEDNRSDKICNNAEYHRHGVKFQPAGEFEQMAAQLYIADLCTFNDQQSKNLFLEFLKYR